MSTSKGRGVERNGIAASHTGDLGVSGYFSSSADHRHSCDWMTESGCHVLRAAIADFVRSSSLLLLSLAILAFIGSCASLHLNPDPEVAPSGDSARVWSPPQSIGVANEVAPKLSELRTIDESNAFPQTNQGAYDLPALVDLALRTNPQTRHAWYGAQAAYAQLGQSQAPNYPKAEVDADGGYLKLPIQFPGQ